MKTPSFPPIDCLLEYFSRVDYKKVAHQFIMVAAATCAIIVATSLFIHRKSREFWDANGEEIISRSKQFISQTAKVLVIIYETAVTAWPVIVKGVMSMQKTTAMYTNLAADWMFYRAILAQ